MKSQLRELVSKTAERMLRKQKYKVVQAADGEEKEVPFVLKLIDQSEVKAGLKTSSEMEITQTSTEKCQQMPMNEKSGTGMRERENSRTSVDELKTTKRKQLESVDMDEHHAKKQKCVSKEHDTGKPERAGQSMAIKQSVKLEAQKESLKRKPEADTEAESQSKKPKLTGREKSEKRLQSYTEKYSWQNYEISTKSIPKADMEYYNECFAKMKSRLKSVTLRKIADDQAVVEYLAKDAGWKVRYM